MSRLHAGSLLVALVAAAIYPVSAQDSEARNEKPKIAVNDPAKLADDLDYAIQGEYVGKLKNAKGVGDLLGAQAIALGDGKFEVKLFRGGLPGAGWDGTSPVAGKGARDRDRVEVKFAEKPEEMLGVLDHGANEKTRIFTALGKEGGSLSKVERKSPTLGAKPPAGAVVLYSGPSDAGKWDRAAIAELSDGKFLTASGVRSKQKFQSFQLHIEFRTPWAPRDASRRRRNGGVFLQDRYELQVLDNFGLKGVSKECGSIYEECELIVDSDKAMKLSVPVQDALNSFLGGLRALKVVPRFPDDLKYFQTRNELGQMVASSSFMRIEKKQYAPKVNMCFPPMSWQTYDVDFVIPELDAAGSKKMHAKVTVKHNGVVVYDGFELKWITPGCGDFDKKLTEPGSLYLPDQDDAVVFNNIWVVSK